MNRQNTYDDPQLIERAKTEPDAFRALYQAYVGRVFAYVVYRVPVRTDAEDLTADIFTQVVKSIQRFQYRGAGSFTAWLFRIAHNTVINYGQRHRHRQTQPPLSYDDLPEIAADYGLPEQALNDKERFVRLYLAIDQLSPRRQEIVRLRYFGGLRNHEIAAVLGLDERTIAAHLSRALVDLQQAFADEIRTDAIK